MKKFISLNFVLIPFLCISQISFTNASSNLMNPNLKSGVAIGISDMNGDNLDDIVRFNNDHTVEIEYQTASGNFTSSSFIFSDFDSDFEDYPWGLVIADVDRDGLNDFSFGGAYDEVKVLLTADSPDTFTERILGGEPIFMQNMNFVDINNDGSIDIFACHDDGLSAPYRNDGTGEFTYDLSLISAVSTVPSDNSGNYGSIWTDYDNDGDIDLYLSKCRLGVNDPNDGQRLNLLFQNDGNGNFVDVAEAAVLLPKQQTWATGFEDIDNDGDMDAVMINHFATSSIYENNGDGTFTDITGTSGITSRLETFGFGIQVVLEDYDNNTFVDILVTAIEGEHVLFLNNGNKTFTEIEDPFPTNALKIQSAASGDLNNDGFIDILAGFSEGFNSPSNNNPDILFLNDGNANNWSKIQLEGVDSNINGIGARIEIEGAWGKQIREVRAGESYGTMNSLMTHFGLGANTEISKITVKWPSGTINEVVNPNINTSILIVESATLSTEQFDPNNFKIYPNPTSNSINIALKEISDLKAVKLYDVLGKQIDIRFNKKESTINIDLSKINSGIYFIHIETATKRLIHKIVKQ